MAKPKSKKSIWIKLNFKKENMKLYYSLLLIFVLLLSCNSKNKSTHELINILKSNRNETYFHKDEIIFFNITS